MNESSAGQTRAGPEAPAASLMQNWPGVFFRQRADFTFEFVSPKIEELTGWPAEVWHRHPALFWQAVHELDADELDQQIKRSAHSPQGTSSTYRVRHAHTGRITYISEFRRAVLDSSGQVQDYEGVWLDVTRQAIAEKRLAEAAWKETLAILTMGLAHDFNNVMAGILSLSESFLAQIGPEHSFQEGLTLIKQNAQQASQLVHRIIHLHHGKTGSRSYHDLNAITEDAVELLRKVIPRRIEVETHWEATPLPLYVDAVEFRQVIINMALNAADAMPDRGKLIFRTTRHHEMAALEHFEGVLPRLPCACLAVEDNGCGIKAHHLASIFDPFFTTKAMNKGSGLGLYNARLFVEKHHGTISVESLEGQGATFQVWLPQADFTEVEHALESSRQQRLSVLLAGRGGKSLQSMAEFLRENNYLVVVGDEKAEELLRSPEYRFDALMVQVEAKDSGPLSLLGNVRKHKLPVKVILQIVGCNQDELGTEFLQRADLILSSEMAQEVVLEKLASIFDAPSA